jgi:isopentenyl-diphosphate delta-isomerase
MDHVILVDRNDNEVGTMDKMEAHRKGILHRAFSILLFNSKGEMLLQKRSASKYHSAGLWTNTCCSHPKLNESLEAAINRRLQEEMGIDIHSHFAYKFQYRAELDNGLIEHELDHVYVGLFNGKPVINSNEVSDWKYATVADIKEDVRRNPDDYTYWFKLIIHHPEMEKSRLALF